MAPETLTVADLKAATGHLAPLLENPSIMASDEIVPEDLPTTGWSDLWRLEDWWAVWLAALLFIICLISVRQATPVDFDQQLAELYQREAQVDELYRQSSTAGAAADSDEAKALEQAGKDLKAAKKSLTATLAKPFKTWIGKPKPWENNPLDSLYRAGEYNLFPALGLTCLVCLLVFGLGLRAMGRPFGEFAVAFLIVFVLATVSYVLAAHKVIKWANLEYPLWALLVSLSISNTIGVSRLLRNAVNTEFYIKTGLVLLGGEVLLSQLLKLGLPGICISWIVTPIVLIGTYTFGQRILKIESKTLNMVISADMSVCGVSAAIATAAACRAKKEELSLAIGISLTFTVVMMILMPMFIEAVGIDTIVGAAWIGGTIDATGAVAAAGEILGQEALRVAATVKMIQNILIGVIAFGVAVYWTTIVERKPEQLNVSPWEIWYRFPKFILGFVAASAIFSFIFRSQVGGEYIVPAVTGGATKLLREWFFCLAFVSIGLETNFRELAKSMKGGKPLVLYVVGQTFSLVLSLFVCWLMLTIVFPDAAAQLGR